MTTEHRRLHGRPEPSRCPAQGACAGRVLPGSTRLPDPPTGPPKAVGLVFRALENRPASMASPAHSLNPVPTGSIVDLTFFFRGAARDQRRGSTNAAVKEVVVRPACPDSSPIPRTRLIVGHRNSRIGDLFDAPFDELIPATQVKAVAWYDNEWGYGPASSSSPSGSSCPRTSRRSARRARRSSAEVAMSRPDLPMRPSTPPPRRSPSASARRCGGPAAPSRCGRPPRSTTCPAAAPSCSAARSTPTAGGPSRPEVSRVATWARSAGACRSGCSAAARFGAAERAPDRAHAALRRAPGRADSAHAST